MSKAKRLKRQKAKKVVELRPSTEPLISVCIPYFRKDDKDDIIERVLDSIFEQDYQDLEIILVCDGEPSDKAKEIFEKIKDRRFRWWSGKKLGAPATRNRAASVATGEFITFWDADTLMMPGALNRFKDALDSEKDHDISYCAHRYSIDPKFGAGDLQGWASRSFNAYDLTQANYIDSCSLLRMSLWKKLQSNGGWDNSLERLQDWDLFLNASINFGAKGVYIPDPLFLKQSPKKGDISDAKGKDWSVAKKVVQDKWNIKRSDVCFTTIVDEDHARRMAEWAGLNYLPGQTFRPFYIPAEWKAVMVVGFHCRQTRQGDELNAHLSMFKDARGEWMEKLKKIIYWTGGDIYNLYAGVPHNQFKMVTAGLNDKIDKHLAATPLVQKQLKEAGIKAEIVNIPYIKDFGFMPMPERFTVAIYIPFDPPNKNLIDFTLEVAKRCKKVKFLAYGPFPQCAWKLPKNVKYVGPQYDEKWGKFIGKCSVLFNLRRYGPILNAHVDFAIAGRQTITNIETAKGVIPLTPPHKIKVTENTKAAVNVEEAVQVIEYAAKQHGKKEGRRSDAKKIREWYLKRFSHEHFKKQMDKIVKEVIGK
jgi:glycosyltransferase involved in cell wall biosynthesis